MLFLHRPPRFYHPQEHTLGVAPTLADPLVSYHPAFLCHWSFQQRSRVVSSGTPTETIGTEAGRQKN